MESTLGVAGAMVGVGGAAWMVPTSMCPVVSSGEPIASPDERLPLSAVRLEGSVKRVIGAEQHPRRLERVGSPREMVRQRRALVGLGGEASTVGSLGGRVDYTGRKVYSPELQLL